MSGAPPVRTPQVTLPMALMSLESADMAGQYLFTSTVAHYAILPLIFTPQEYAIKVRLYSFDEGQ